MNLTDPGVLVPLSIATLAFGLALAGAARRWWTRPIVSELREIKRLLGGRKP